MAGGAAGNVLEDELSCPVCLSTYQEPVLLGCSHCFCRQCITEVLCRQKDEGKPYTCPMCQAHYQDFPTMLNNLQLSSIVESFVSVLKNTEGCNAIPCDDCLDHPNMAVQTCASCEVSLCHKHVERHRKKNHRLLEPTASVQDRKCPEHDKLLEYYCEKHNSCICVTCYIAGSHKGHTIVTLKQAHEKHLATLSVTTSALSASVSEFSKHIKDLNAGLEKITSNTVKLSKPLQDLCDRIISLVRDQFNKTAEEVITSQAEATTKMTAIVKQMEDAKTNSQKALQELQLISKQPDELLFMKNYNRSQSLISPKSPQMNAMQVVDVEADKTMIENIEQETSDYIVRISQHLKYTHHVLSQQVEQLMWSGTQWKKIQNPQKISQIRSQKSKQLNLSFGGLNDICHCRYNVTVSSQSKTLTAKIVPGSEQGFGLGFQGPRNNAFQFQSSQTFASQGFGHSFHAWQQQPAFFDGTPRCNCKLPIVIPDIIARPTSSRKVHCLVDVSKSDDWCVGVTNIRSERRYLQWNKGRLSYESDASLSLGSAKINILKIQLDFEDNLLGFYDVFHEAEIPMLICKCDDIFTKPLNFGFNILGGSLSLI